MLLPSVPLTRGSTLSQQLAEYVHDLRFSDLPTEVVEKAKDIIVYSIGHALDGHFTADGRHAINLARRLSGGSAGPATIIGAQSKVLPLDAAFANCTLMRALEMDAILFPVGIHAALVTLPAGLALAEERRLSGQDLLVATVAGFDVMGKLGKGLWDWAAETPRRPTIPFGPFGGAVVAAKLLRLSPAKIDNAIGYAAQSAMGVAVDPWTHYYSLVVRNGMMKRLPRRGARPDVPAGSGGEVRVLPDLLRFGAEPPARIHRQLGQRVGNPQHDHQALPGHRSEHRADRARTRADQHARGQRRQRRTN
jgi:hypothetical protein